MKIESVCTTSWTCLEQQKKMVISKNQMREYNCPYPGKYSLSKQTYINNSKLKNVNLIKHLK